MRMRTIFPRTPASAAGVDPLQPQARPSNQRTCALPSRTAGPVDALSQYLESRGQDNRAVSPTSRRMLERATNAVDTVRKQIPIRGNVKTDLVQTEQQAAHRLHASRNTVMANMVKQLTSSNTRPPPALSGAVICAAAARVTGAGNCDEFQSATLLEAGKTLEQGERLVATLNDAKNHAFVQMESQRPDGTLRVVVLDAWANGPAVLAEDCAYAQMNPGIHLRELNDRLDAFRADRVATHLVNAHNNDPVSMQQLRTTLTRQYNEPAPSDFLFDECHVSGRTVVARAESLANAEVDRAGLAHTGSAPPSQR